MPERRGRAARAALMRRRMIAGAVVLALVGGAAAAVVLLLGNGGDEVADDEASPGSVRRTELEEPATVGSFELVVTKAACGFQSIIREETLVAEGEWCTVDFQITNEGDQTASLPLECQIFTDSEGETHQPDEPATLSLGESEKVFGQGLEPGESVDETAGLAYDVPDGRDATSLELHADCADEGVVVDLTS